jgi:ABC-type cobalamin/Fe3+-siderophores transport system ATPase subunit
MSPVPKLGVRGVGWDVGGQSILGSIDLDLSSGECLVIVGPNGAGKTTLLRIMAGLLAPTRGELLWDQVPYRELGRRDLASRISYVPQSRPLRVPLTVEDLVLQGRYPYLSPFRLAPRAEDFAAVERAMDLAGISTLRRRALEELSGGERQSAYIAAALAQEAEVLILDEPTTHLDPRHQREIAALVMRLNREQGMSVALATHDLNFAALLADHMVALQRGEITASGTPGEFLGADQLAAIFDAPFTVVRAGDRPLTLLEMEP